MARQGGKRTDETTVRTVVFGFLVAAMAVTILVGLTLRAPLWDASVAAVAGPVGFAGVFGGLSEYVNMLLVFGVLGAAYIGCLHLLRRGLPHGMALALGGTAVACAVFLPMRPLNSPDVTHLAADVRTLWLHGKYPASSANTPSTVDDPVARQVASFTKAPSGYGPVAYIVGGAVLPFAGDSVIASVFGQKVLDALFLVLTALATGLAARRMGANAGLAAGFVGLNPLLLWEFAGNGHNDSLMTAFAVAAMLFLFEPGLRSKATGAGLLALSVLSKYALALAGPVVLAAWFPRWRLYVAGLVLLLGIPAAWVAVFGSDFGVPAVGPATTISPLNMAATIHRWAHGGPDFQRNLVFGCFVLYTVIAALITRYHPLQTAEDRAAAIALSIWLFQFLCFPGLLPWYQSWYLPFAILSRKRWLVVMSIVFSLGILVCFLTYQWSLDLEAHDFNDMTNRSLTLLWLGTAITAVWLWARDHGVWTDAPKQKAPTRAARRRATRMR